MFLEKTLFSSLLTVLLCPTLMNMLVTSPFRQWMLDRSGQPSLKIPDQAHVSKHLRTVVFEEGGELQETPVTYSGFFLYGH